MTLPAMLDTDRDALRADIAAACAKVAPTWPLDRMIAVNPYWGWTSRSVYDAAAELGALAAAPFLMPRRWYREQREKGLIPDAALQLAGARSATSQSPQLALAALEATPPALPRHPMVTAIRDALRDPHREATWEEHVQRQVGQTCAAYFDVAQAIWQPPRDGGLYAFWRRLAANDATPQLLLGDRDVRRAIADLPQDPQSLIAEALDTLSVPAPARERYLSAVLLHIGGWASHAAFRRWDARLHGHDDASIEELLAVRLAWELVLYRTASGTDVPARWTRKRREWQASATEVRKAQESDWMLQRAFELRFQDKLGAALAWQPAFRSAFSGSKAPATISAQAVFCIDVRSEVLRRHLEDVAPELRTLGFAGFFGIPLAYDSLNGDRRPQLPGLLAAAFSAVDADAYDPGTRADASRKRAAEQQWKAAATSLPATFPVVETTGLAAAAKLALATIEPTRAVGDPLRAGRDHPDHQSSLSLRAADGSELSDAARTALALGILRGMSLVKGYAPLVALVGHGSLVTNNPQAAGLACGACGGQSGEVNARVAAALLNDAAVRQGLRDEGVEIPLETRFVAGVHDTTTDDVLLFPDAQTAASHADDIAELSRAFSRAARRVRVERASRLGELPSEPDALAEALRQRAADWSEVRPEWALARNAAFIAAPRSRSRALDLKGRAFLHEYDSALDPDGAVLESILTAPVVVAHWINFQYWASTVDPTHFGSGDKTRHNVVGGHLGVVEGAGGDLRIGLAQQSVHDGENFVHEPMRLAVYVEADETTVEAILARQPAVRNLVDGEWLFLYRIDPADAGVFLRRGPGWELVAPGATGSW